MNQQHLENAIYINDLHKQYPQAEFKALDGLSLSFKKGGIAGILGPNGAGKTTTISILCGLVKKDQGKVTVMGLDNEHDTHEIQRRIGIVPQQTSLFPNLTGYENLEYIGRLYHVPAGELKQRIMELMTRLGLEKHMKKRVQHYSGGMKRRANICAGLLHTPEMLILDEPTAGVDVQSRAMILDFLQEYNSKGNTILYTSHLLEEAERICDDVAIVDQGRVIAQDSPRQLVAQTPNCKNLEEVFLNYTGRLLRE